jgi:hypothetical protein
MTDWRQDEAFVAVAREKWSGDYEYAMRHDNELAEWTHAGIYMKCRYQGWLASARHHLEMAAAECDAFYEASEYGESVGADECRQRIRALLPQTRATGGNDE